MGQLVRVHENDKQLTSSSPWILDLDSSATDRTSDDAPPTQSTGAVAKMISRPFSSHYDSHVPQAKAKRSKKNITFAQVSKMIKMV